MTYATLFSDVTLAKLQVDKWKEQNKKIVFTNGCFDILHTGHTTYLKEARELGDRLIVGLNSDASVKKLKGNSRPIQGLQERAAVLCALRSVDMVISFSEETPINLITQLIPDVLVKGGDYTINEMIGKDFIEQEGGKVNILSFKEDISTSDIIHRIQNLPHED